MLRPFDYIRPANLDEATAYLREEGSVALAGGTDLLLEIRNGDVKAKKVIDLKGLPELRGIKETENGELRVGAVTTMRELALHAGILTRYPALWKAASVMGCYEIRGRATIGGNICNASPGADTGPALLVHKAKILVHGPHGQRLLPIDEFFTGPGRTALQPGEVLAAVLLPAPTPGTTSAYLRRSRIQGMDLASIGLAMLVAGLGGNGPREVRVGVNAVAPTPVRIKQVEEILSQAPVTKYLLARAKEIMASSILPRASSIRATPEYKKAMAGVLLEMAAQQLLGPIS